MAAEVTTLIYFAQPIDQAGDGLQRPWNRVAQAVVAEANAAPGVVGFHPVRAFTVGPDATVDPRLEQINREALDRCDAMLAIIPAGVPTVGTPRELEAALTAGKPVAVVTDLTGRSWSLGDANQFPLTLPGVRDAIAWLVEESQAIESAELSPYEIAFTVEDGGTSPTRHSPHDAGYDLYVSRDTVIEPGCFADVHTGIRVAMPQSMWGRIVGRSSTRRKRGLLVIEGVIDPGYRGLLYSGVHNLSDVPVEIKAGERLAQFIPHINMAPSLSTLHLTREEFDAIPHDGRGENGFGSSGH